MHVSDTAAGVLEQVSFNNQSDFVLCSGQRLKKEGQCISISLHYWKKEAKMLQKWLLSADGRHLESVQIVS